jgi:hypothetical protein
MVIGRFNCFEIIFVRFSPDALKLPYIVDGLIGSISEMGLLALFPYTEIELM